MNASAQPGALRDLRDLRMARRDIRRIDPNPANRRCVTWLLHDIRIRRAIRAIDAAIPGEAIRPAGHAATGNEPAGALLAGHTRQLPFAGFGALRGLLRREGQREQQKAGEENFAHDAYLAGKG